MTACVDLEEALHSQETQDNSDDDVIEVVRDEAPIEILSDGEEFEIQLQKSQDALKDIVIENVMPLESNEEKDKELNKDPAEDPLQTDSHNTFCSDLLDALNPHANQASLENSAPTEMEVNSKILTDSTNPTASAQNPTVMSNDNSDRIESIPNDNDDGLIGVKARLIQEDGRSVLMLNKHRYMRHYTSRGGRTRWRCCKSFNKCLAIAITYENQIVKLNDIHNHEPLSPVKKVRKTRIVQEPQSLDFSMQPSQPDVTNFRSNWPMPTLEISPLGDSDDKFPRISERIVVKPCEDLFS